MSESQQTVYDVIIIGAGPAGGTAAIYAARARLKTLVIDKAKLGGSLSLAPWIANFPGISKPVPGAELARIIKQQALDFGAEYLQAPVLGVDFSGEPKQVFTTEGVRAGKTGIVATGALGRGARVPGEDDFIGRGVSYCATCDGPFYHGKVVAVLGNTEEAFDDALLLTKFAERVYLVVPGPKAAVEDEVRRAIEAEPKIELLMDHRLTEIRGDQAVREVALAGGGGEAHTLAVDGVFIYLAGNKPVTDFLQGALDVTDNGCIRADHTMATSIPGVFAAGDVRCTDFRQAVISAADGAIAAMSADRYVNRRESFRPSR
jgi:thioredoxin reductase (NADPH)